ncbi:hypothetical protein FXO38_26009 [Capsicum annuum]|nr:hypothetical protein FXO38_26009 [Capsicum annuum]
MEVAIQHDKRLLSDNKTIVVGIGIEDVVKKLEKDYNMKISKWVDLRDMARERLSLWRLLSDNKTIVVGIGIEDVVKKLEKDYNMTISKWVDLRDMTREKATFGEIANKCSVEKLAKKVLGDEWDVVN